jgi:hypothetical protein
MRRTGGSALARRWYQGSVQIQLMRAVKLPQIRRAEHDG